MKTISLKVMLQLSVMVLIIIIGFATSQFAIQRYSNALLESAEAKAETIAHKLAIDTADLVLINDLVTLQKTMDNQLLTTPNVAYIFIERDNQVIVHTFKEGIPSDLIQLHTPLDGQTGHIEKIKSEAGERLLDLAWPIFEGHAGVLRLGYSENRYIQQIRELRLQMSLITALMIVAALIASHFLLTYLTRPLTMLTRSVEQIHEGNLETRLSVRGRREVTQLTETFNRMLDRLKDYTQKLDRSNQTLLEKNLALERAHKQLSSSVIISKEIAGLPKLQDICAFLLSTFRDILTCQQMAFLLFSPAQKLFLVTEQEQKELGDSEYHDASSLLSGLKSNHQFPAETFSFLNLPERVAMAAKLTVFPLREHGRLLGILIVGCREHCACKPEELAVVEPVLNQSVGAFQRAITLEEELRNLNRTIDRSNEFYGLIGRDPNMQAVFQLIENVSVTDASVLIQGESGTGKELVAHAIHTCSPRKEKPFTIINCSAYPATLLESELFGYEKGAFSGAARRKAGRFEQADGGTVFLDEIGEIPPSAQIKLLRVLQSRKFERLGGEQTLTVNVRVLAATNKDLAQEVQTGRFREDLYYRLNVIPIHLPPLRDRKNDIFLLAKHFLKKFTKEQNKPVTEFSSEAMACITDYPWPGNVRELENTIEYAVVMAKGYTIELLDLPLSITDIRTDNKIQQVTTLSETEEDLIRRTLEEYNWNKSKVAEKIGVSRGTLYQKIKKYGIRK